jgi:hypothetical protein
MSHDHQQKFCPNENVDKILENLIEEIDKNADSNWSRFYGSITPVYVLNPDSKEIPKFYKHHYDSFLEESYRFYQSNQNIPLSYLFLGLYKDYYIEKGKICKETIDVYSKGRNDPFCMIKLAESYIRLNENGYLKKIITLLISSFIITSIESHKFLNQYIQIKTKPQKMEVSSFDNFFYLSYYYDTHPNIFFEAFGEVISKEKISEHFKEALILIFTSMHNTHYHKDILQKLLDAVKSDDRKAAFHYCCFSIYLAKITNSKINNVDALFHILKVIADEGNPLAAEKLAVLYEHIKDYKNAFNYYIKAEDYLLPNSLNQLGIYYCSIKNPLKNIDTKKAYEYWTKATYSGMAVSFEYLKLILINRDNKRVFVLSDYYHKCKITCSAVFLGYCYEKGRGVEKNLKIAIGIYKSGMKDCRGGTVLLYRIGRILEKEKNMLCNEIYHNIFNSYQKLLDKEKSESNNMWIIDSYRLASMYKSGRGTQKNCNFSIQLLDSILNARITEDTQPYICIYFYLLAFPKKLALTKLNNCEKNKQNNQEKSLGINMSNSLLGPFEINPKSISNKELEIIEYNSRNTSVNTGDKDIKMETDNECSNFKTPHNKMRNKTYSMINREPDLISINRALVSNNCKFSKSHVETNHMKEEFNKYDEQKIFFKTYKDPVPKSFYENVMNQITKIFSGKKLPQKHENDLAIIKELMQKINSSGTYLIDYNDIMFDTLIGSGGYSKVFSGWIEKRIYAVKEFQHVNEITLRKIIEEINIQISLKHENINSSLYIAFDLNPFKIACVNKLMLYNLRYVINNVKPKIQLKTKIVRQILHSLDFLHSQSPPVVHRDLKPENILLDENFHVEICDFGVFKLLEGNKTCSETLNQFYTVRYSPPEVIQNRKFICKASDIWSVGLIIYDIFYEEQPWSGLSNEEIIDCIKKQRPFQVKSNDTIPTYIIAMIKRCTNYDYSLRPKVSDLLEEVDKFMKETEILCF